MSKTPPRTSRENTFELITQAGTFLDFLPPSRARSMVATKLDEALMWLKEVEPDQSPEDDPFGIKAGRDAMESEQAKKKEGSS